MSEAKIKAIVKRPDETYGHVTYLSNNLKALQKVVGGHIETVTVGKVVIICDEEGRDKESERNCAIPAGTMFPTMFYGTIAVVGIDGDEFADVPIDFSTWKTIYLGGR